MLHIYAALAVQERCMISQRTKAALAEVKRRGVQLGNPERAKANRLEAEAHAERLRPVSVIYPASDCGPADQAPHLDSARRRLAKLDRLSRNVAFIAMLIDRKVDFVCCDNSTATKFTIHNLAAVAEHERDAILRPALTPRDASASCAPAPRPMIEGALFCRA